MGDQRENKKIPVDRVSQGIRDFAAFTSRMRELIPAEMLENGEEALAEDQLAQMKTDLSGQLEGVFDRFGLNKEELGSAKIYAPRVVLSRSASEIFASVGIEKEQRIIVVDLSGMEVTEDPKAEISVDDVFGTGDGELLNISLDSMFPPEAEIPTISACCPKRDEVLGAFINGHESHESNFIGVAVDNKSLLVGPCNTFFEVEDLKMQDQGVLVVVIDKAVGSNYFNAYLSSLEMLGGWEELLVKDDGSLIKLEEFESENEAREPLAEVWEAGQSGMEGIIRNRIADAVLEMGLDLKGEDINLCFPEVSGRSDTTYHFLMVGVGGLPKVAIVGMPGVKVPEDTGVEMNTYGHFLDIEMSGADSEKFPIVTTRFPYIRNDGLVFIDGHGSQYLRQPSAQVKDGRIFLGTRKVEASKGTENVEGVLLLIVEKNPNFYPFEKYAVSVTSVDFPEGWHGVFPGDKDSLGTDDLKKTVFEAKDLIKDPREVTEAASTVAQARSVVESAQKVIPFRDVDAEFFFPSYDRWTVLRDAPGRKVSKEELMEMLRKDEIENGRNPNIPDITYKRVGPTYEEIIEIQEPKQERVHFTSPLDQGHSDEEDHHDASAEKERAESQTGTQNQRQSEPNLSKVRGTVVVDGKALKADRARLAGEAYLRLKAKQAKKKKNK